MDRREIIGLGVVAAALAKPALADTVLPGDGRMPGDPTEEIMLWPGIPPGGEGVSLPPVLVSRHEPPFPISPDRAVNHVGRPFMSVFRPQKPDGSALILAPGGGYVTEMLDYEGSDVARHFNAAGVTCFVLRYRLPGEGWARRQDVPLQDAQRAMRLVRAQAAKYGVDPTRIGFMGFSAGGHVACSIATRFAANVYTGVDEADTANARPDFSVPMYPVVTMGPGCHAGSRDHLLGDNPTPEMIDAYSCEKHIPADAPPSFLCMAADDTTVPPLPNGIAYYTALRAANIPAELHVFESGGHGFGIARTVGKPDAAWVDLVLAWGRSKGIFRNA